MSLIGAISFVRHGWGPISVTRTAAPNWSQMFWNSPEIWNLGFAALIVAVLISLVAARAWGRITVHPIAPAGVGASTPAGGLALEWAGVGASTPAGGPRSAARSGVGPSTAILPAVRLERPG